MPTWHRDITLYLSWLLESEALITLGDYKNYLRSKTALETGAKNESQYRTTVPND